VSRGRYVATKVELARRCGITHRTLCRYFNERGHPPDHSPGKARYDVEQWKGWIQGRKSAHNFGKNDNGYAPNEREKLLIEKKQIEIERERFKLDVERGKYELKSVITERILKNLGLFVRELDKSFKHELPPRLEGLSAGEIAKVCGRRLDELRERVAKAFRNEAPTPAMD
jgi:hypothetical protein